MKENKGWQGDRYKVTKNSGMQDPRAVYVVLRVDPFGKDTKYIQACRDTILESLVPNIQPNHPDFAAELEDLINHFNDQPFSFPPSAEVQDLPSVGDVFLKQGQGLKEITGVSIDPASNDFMIHFKDAGSPANTISFVVPFSQFMEQEAADGVRIRTWQKVDPGTGQPINDPESQLLEAEEPEASEAPEVEAAEVEAEAEESEEVYEPDSTYREDLEHY